MAGLEADDGEAALFCFVDGGDGGADLARGAIAALEGIVFDEGGLNGVETLDAVTFGEAFDCGDLRAFGGEGEGEAGVDAAAVEKDGTSPALSVIAAFFTAGEVEVLAHRVEEGGSGIESEGVFDAVDLEGDLAGVLGGLGQRGQASRGYGGECAGGLDEGAASKGEVSLGETGRLLFVKFDFRFGAKGGGHGYLGTAWDCMGTADRRTYAAQNV